MELQLHATHVQAMGLYKLCKPSEKGLYLYWNSSIPQKYFSKSISLLLKLICPCRSGQLSCESSDSQHSFTFGRLPTPQTWLRRRTPAQTQTWPVPAREHRDTAEALWGHSKVQGPLNKASNQASPSRVSCTTHDSSESGDTFAQAAKRSYECPIPTSAQGKDEQGLELPGLVEGAPDHARGWNWMFLKASSNTNHPVIPWVLPSLFF